MATLKFSAKPGTNSILVYEPIAASIDKFMEAIFARRVEIATNRLHMKGNKYMYIPSDEYNNQKLIRVKNFAR